MKTNDLFIPEPCSAPWEQMRGDERRRFCSLCDKHVHHLSMMTRQQAQALLAARGQDPHLCVQYASDERGQIMFRDDPSPTWRLFSQGQGVKLLVSAAALVVPMLLSGCDAPSPEPSAQTISPIKLVDGQPPTLELRPEGADSSSAPGSGRAPQAPDAPPLPQAEHEPFEITGGKPRPPATEEPSCDGDKPTAQPSYELTVGKPRMHVIVVEEEPKRADRSRQSSPPKPKPKPKPSHTIMRGDVNAKDGL